MKILRPVLLLAMCFGGAGLVSASFVRPEPVPIDRLLKRAEAHLADHPNSPGAHYLLARIHYLAFVRSSQEVPAHRGALDEPGKPHIATDWQLLPGMTRSIDERAFQRADAEVGYAQPRVKADPERFRKWKQAYDRHMAELTMEAYRQELRARWTNAAAISVEKSIGHVTAALKEFHLAIHLPPEEPVLDRDGKPVLSKNQGLYVLGLASLMEQFADWKQVRQPAGLSAELRQIDHRQARAAYLDAFRMAFAYEGFFQTRPISGFASMVSFEAGWAFIRLTEKDTPQPEAGSELAKALVEVKAGLAKIRELPQYAITPIIFSLQDAASIDSLLAPEITVAFDLGGFGSVEQWPWVRPGTAFLVWDPKRKGEILSGRQLFGGYTFELFWSDGYAALAALDDNGDGTLRNGELEGIRAWFDNGNGQSESGEVRDLAELGIVGIAVHTDTHDGMHPTNPRGLQLRDANTRPTWDWIAEPAQPDPK